MPLDVLQMLCLGFFSQNGHYHPAERQLDTPSNDSSANRRSQNLLTNRHQHVKITSPPKTTKASATARTLNFLVSGA